MNLIRPPLEQYTNAPANKKLFFFLAILLAIAARLGLSTLGHNFDFESWQEVASLQAQGKNGYAATCRYNYGPLWMWILYGLKYISVNHFRTAVALFLSLIDVAIALVLFRRGNRSAAYVILFSPVCLIITGFHNQMDNMAILLMLLALRYAEKRRHYSNEVSGFGLSITETTLLAALIGASLVAKHIFIFLPVWLLFHKQLTIKQKAILVLVPYAIFFGSFLPYLSGIDGILNNVIFYSPGVNAPLYNLLLGRFIGDMMCFIFPTPYKAIFFSIMIGSGFFLRRKPLVELILLYTAFVVMFASLISNQYLVIPMVFLAVSKNRFGWAYNVLGGVFLLFNELELNFIKMSSGEILKWASFIEMWGYSLLTGILLLAVIDFLRPSWLHRSTIVPIIRRWLA